MRKPLLLCPDWGVMRVGRTREIGFCPACPGPGEPDAEDVGDGRGDPGGQPRREC